MIKTIELSQGFVAIVNDQDFEWLNQRKWSVTNGNSPNSTHYTDTYYIQCYAGWDPIKKKDRTPLRMHQEIWKKYNGDYNNKTHCIDHGNNNPLDCRLENLRLVPRAANSYNKKKTTKPCSSQYKGVYWNKQHKCWEAGITHKRKRYFLGMFDTEREGARNYDRKAIELFGEFACTNFPKEEYEVL